MKWTVKNVWSKFILFFMLLLFNQTLSNLNNHFVTRFYCGLIIRLNCHFSQIVSCVLFEPHQGCGSEGFSSQEGSQLYGCLCWEKHICPQISTPGLLLLYFIINATSQPRRVELLLISQTSFALNNLFCSISPGWRVDTDWSVLSAVFASGNLWPLHPPRGRRSSFQFV